MYYTTINSIDNRTIMIPNANLTNHTIINVTAMDRRKLEIKVGISYESDIRKAKDILRRLVEEEPHFQSEEQQFFVDELGESAITVGLRAWVATENYWPVKWKMNERIKKSLTRREFPSRITSSMSTSARNRRTKKPEKAINKGYFEN